MLRVGVRLRRPHGRTLGYDLIAQAASGLLLADAASDDQVPRRSGGIAMADLTAGLLTFAAASPVSPTASGDTTRPASKGFEVSLLGASLAVQVQRFVSVGDREFDGAPAVCDETRLEQLAETVTESDELEPYYRCYGASDGYIALACLNLEQRRRVQALLGIDDPWAVNPQSEPADQAERVMRSR